MPQSAHPLVKETAVVLHTTPLRETDLIITLLCADSGKISALAKGARASKKRFMGGLDVFDCFSAELKPPTPKFNLYLLQGVSERKVWLRLRKSMLRLSTASFCLETANAFSPEGDSEGAVLFKPLYTALDRLNNAESEESAYGTASQFALRLLKMSGFNVLDDQKLQLDIELRTLWELALEEDEPKDMGKKSFVFLAGYIQNILGYKLKTLSLG